MPRSIVLSDGRRSFYERSAAFSVKHLNVTEYANTKRSINVFFKVESSTNGLCTFYFTIFWREFGAVETEK